MNRKILRIGVIFILVALVAAFASQIAVALADARYDERINHVAPIFGVAIAILLVGGYRYLAAIFIGTIIPPAFAESDFLIILSTPVAVVAAATFSKRVLVALQADPMMERIRDAFLVLFWSALVGTF